MDLIGAIPANCVKKTDSNRRLLTRARKDAWTIGARRPNQTRNSKLDNHHRINERTGATEEHSGGDVRFGSLADIRDAVVLSPLPGVKRTQTGGKCQRRTKSTALAGVKMHHCGGAKLVQLG